MYNWDYFLDQALIPREGTLTDRGKHNSELMAQSEEFGRVDLALFLAGAYGILGRFSIKDFVSLGFLQTPKARQGFWPVLVRASWHPTQAHGVRCIRYDTMNSIVPKTICYFPTSSIPSR